MGTLDRITMIVRSNVNAMLDKAENPERQLTYFIQEMADNIKAAELDVQNSLIQVKMLQKQSEEAHRKAQDWESKAERALKAGREDLAREALRLKAQADEEATTYQTQYDQQTQQQKELNAQLVLLRRKYDEVQLNKTNLLARFNMAKINNKVYGEKDPATGLSNSDYSRMERKIIASEVVNELSTPSEKAAMTEAAIDSLPGGSDDLDAELAALKAKMNLGKKTEDNANKDKKE